MSDTALANLFWTLFADTGSLVAYLIYRRFTVH